MAMIAVLTLGACASAPAMRDGGIATYDALRAAQADCAARNGRLKLKGGGDAKYLEDYGCERN